MRFVAAGVLGALSAAVGYEGPGAREAEAPGATAGKTAERRSLLWPLEGPAPIVASFGEYRYDHMHAGIDISTGGATGLKVLAADDGEIVRLKVEWRGYGRALYLRHHDGRTTVYAHLERYEDRTLGLERIVARRQAAAGTRYPGSIDLDRPLPVRRGQVVAFSGESGAGPPHLHFEVRGRADQPLDPFRAGLRAPADRQPPDLESVTVTAADPMTYIDGVLRERTYPLQRRGTQHESQEPVRVSGPFHAILDAFDPVPGGRVGIRFLEVLVDGRPTYRLDYEAFRFDQYPLSGLIHDHRFSHLGPTRFAYRLARLPGNALAAGSAATDSEAGSPPGSFDLPAGPHRLDLTVRDASGATSRARLCVFVARTGPVAGARVPEAGEALPGSAMARFDPLPAPAAKAAVAAGQPQAAVDAGLCVPDTADLVEGEIWSEAGKRFERLDCRAAQGLCLARGPLAASVSATTVRLRLIGGGVPGPWQSLPADTAAQDPLRLRVEPLPAFIDLALPSEPARTLDAPDGQECSPPGAASWRPLQGRWLGSGIGYERAAAMQSGGGQDESDCRLRRGLGGIVLRYVEPSAAARLTGPGFRIDMPAGARFYPGPLAARTAPAADLPPGLTSGGAAVDVLPEGEALNERAVLSFDLGAGTSDARDLGIFRFDPVTQEWSFEGDALEEGGRAIALPFRRHGRFALLRDTAAPVVVSVRPRPDARQVGRRPEILAQIEEIGKGLGPDGVSFVLDGAPLESEFDPDRRTARPFAAPVLQPGWHHLRVVATDRAGNVSTPLEARFEVR